MGLARRYSTRLLCGVELSVDHGAKPRHGVVPGRLMVGRTPLAPTDSGRRSDDPQPHQEADKRDNHALRLPRLWGCQTLVYPPRARSDDCASSRVPRRHLDQTVPDLALRRLRVVDDLANVIKDHGRASFQVIFPIVGRFL
jgi:hypothetical protein